MTRIVTLLGYGIIASCALVLEVVARRSERLAAFGDVLASALGRWYWRVLLQVGWLWLGWHLFVRVDRR